MPVFDEVKVIYTPNQVFVYGTDDDDLLWGNFYGWNGPGQPPGWFPDADQRDSRIDANGGNDTVQGQSGSDVIDGGDGNDLLRGGRGDDTMIGGAGRDSMTGGRIGEDVYLFDSQDDSGLGTNRDVIFGFNQGLDRIDLKALDVVFIGGQKFSEVDTNKHDVELRVVSNGVNTSLRADFDDDDVVDFAIVVRGDFALTATDFIL